MHKIKEEPSMNICSDISKMASHYPALITASHNVDGSISCYSQNQLQLELENLLCFLMKKYNNLSKKSSVLDELVDKKKEKSEALNTGGIKVSVPDDRPHKKIKIASEKPNKSSLSTRAKCKKMQQPAKSNDHGFPGKSDILKVPKNDSPNRFWAYIEPYCSDLTMEDIKMLEKWVESHDQGSEYQNIPELGEHYTSKWIENDLLNELKEGSKSVENPIGRDIGFLDSGYASNLINRVEDKINVLDSEHPSLVQKLISSLVQENIITSSNDLMAEAIPDNLLAKKTSEPSSFHMNRDTLENRICGQLIEHGLLENLLKEMNDDELLLELKRGQDLLMPIFQRNLLKKQKLLARAKTAVARQESQKRIQEADAKVMENYRTMYAARSKGKKMSKKEQNHIKSILEEREAVITNSELNMHIL